MKLENFKFEKDSLDVKYVKQDFTALLKLVKIMKIIDAQMDIDVGQISQKIFQIHVLKELTILQLIGLQFMIVCHVFQDFIVVKLAKKIFQDPAKSVILANKIRQKKTQKKIFVNLDIIVLKTFQIQ